MAWVSDTNLPSSLFMIDAVSPFPVSGGNKIIALTGGGVIYKNDISFYSQDIEIDFASYKTNHSNGRNSFGIIARRQSNGNFYYGAAAIRRGGSAATYQIFTYTAISDTFTQIVTSGSLPNDVPDESAVHKLMFRLRGTSLSILFNGSNRVSVTNSFITLPGNPGLASNLFNVDSLGAGAAADNMIIRSYD